VFQDLTYEAFAKLVNQRFSLLHDSGKLEVELIECKTLSAHAGAAHGKPFSLIFRAPAKPLLPQRIYRFDFGEAGSSDIFIVPIGPDDVGMRYEAVFN
jgi:hypothetical protein